MGTRAGLRPSRETMWKIEQHAMAIRAKAGVGREEPVDPFHLASKFGLVIVHPSDVEGAADEDLEKTMDLDARTWSGMGKSLPDGRILIMLNPTMTLERARVTALEEVAHVYFDHKPTMIATNPDGFERRAYDSQTELEAYWTAAAVLLPSRVVGRAVWNGVQAEELGSQFGTSTELVEMRVKTLRLWPLYHRHAA